MLTPLLKSEGTITIKPQLENANQQYAGGIFLSLLGYGIDMIEQSGNNEVFEFNYKLTTDAFPAKAMDFLDRLVRETGAEVKVTGPAKIQP